MADNAEYTAGKFRTRGFHINQAYAALNSALEKGIELKDEDLAVMARHWSQ